MIVFKKEFSEALDIFTESVAGVRNSFVMCKLKDSKSIRDAIISEINKKHHNIEASFYHTIVLSEKIKECESCGHKEYKKNNIHIMPHHNLKTFDYKWTKGLNFGIGWLLNENELAERERITFNDGIRYAMRLEPGVVLIS